MSIEAQARERSIPILTGLRRLFSKPHKVEQGNNKGNNKGYYQQRFLGEIGFSHAFGRSDNVSRQEFLKRAKVDFNVSRIYYPGVGEDLQLEKAFNRSEIFYLDLEDEEYEFECVYDQKTNYFIRANMAEAPFQDNVFDAVFIQDIHANEGELKDILRTLRPNGLVIFSLDDCVEGDMNDLMRLQHHPELENLELPYHNHIFKAFRKRETASPNGSSPIKGNLEQGVLL